MRRRIPIRSLRIITRSTIILIAIKTSRARAIVNVMTDDSMTLAARSRTPSARWVWIQPVLGTSSVPSAPIVMPSTRYSLCTLLPSVNFQSCFSLLFFLASSWFLLLPFFHCWFLPSISLNSLSPPRTLPRSPTLASDYTPPSTNSLESTHSLTIWSRPAVGLMSSVVPLHPTDQRDWMNPSQCNGSWWPVASLSDDRVMTSPSPTSVNLNPSFGQPNLGDIRGGSPTKLRRRASQGSFRTKPSPVSRFLSKGSGAVHFPSWEQHRAGSPGSPFRAESRPRSSDSRLRLSTTISRGPRTVSGHPSSSWEGRSRPSSVQSDYPTTLPLTPPDDDAPVAWNPLSKSLLFDTPIQQDQGAMPMVDEGPSAGNSPAVGPSDGLSSPSDQLSHTSSSSGGSPGPHDAMDCQQDVGSWLDHGINATGECLSR